MSSIRAAGLVFVVSLAAYSFELGTPHLSGTEGHRALTAHQMVESGEWLIPRLYDRVYLRKPPLAYWIIAAGEAIAGRGNEWVWRMPSAIASAALAGALCLFADMWFGSPAGILAGFSHLALVAVWQESRSADIDALDSLASVLAACLLIHLQMGQVRRKWLVVVWAGLAIGAALLIKGPQGMTIIGGAMVGPWIVRRKWSPGAFIALGVGILCLGLYVLAAVLYLRASHLPLDFSGLSEAADKTRPGIMRFVMAIWATIQAVAYALPVPLAIPVVWKDSRPVVRAVLATVLVGLGFGILGGVENTRYLYVILPMMCPLAGAALAKDPRSMRILPWAVAGLLVGMIPFALMAKRLPSAYDAAQILKENVPRGTTVVAGNVVLDQPELFYYAGIDVNSGLVDSDLEHATPGHWLVLKQDENDAWAGRIKSKPIELWHDKRLNLVWYGQ